MDPPSAGNVTCPTCGAPVSVSLPRSASRETVTGGPVDDLEADTAENPRSRCLTFTCPADHDVYVYFDW